MAWQATLTNSLRAYIGDLDSKDYTNDRLQLYISLGAAAVISEIALITTVFTIDTYAPSITPDPTTDTSIDIGIPNLFILKAACIISMSELRKDKAKYGIKIRDENTSYDGTSTLKSMMDTTNIYFENYEKARWDWEKGNKVSLRAIFGPYESANLGNIQLMLKRGIER